MGNELDLFKNRNLQTDVSLDQSSFGSTSKITVKELSEILKVSVDLVQKRIKELYPSMMKPRVTTYLTEEEATAVKLRIFENTSLIATDDHRQAIPKTELEKKLLIQQAMNFLNEEIEELKQINKQQETLLIEQAPKVEYCDNVLDSKSCFTVTQIASGLGLTAQKLNKFLCENKIQYKQSGQYFLYGKYKGLGYTGVRTVPFFNSKGEKETKHETVWTEKGREFITGVYSTGEIK